MKRFLPIITIILVLTLGLFNTKTFAIDPSPPIVLTSEEDPTLWEKFVKWLFSFRKLFAKKYTLDLERDKLITEFSAEDTVTADVSTRAISESIRDEMKMDYLRGVLETPPKFDPTVYLATCDDKVTIEDLANYKINKTPPTKGSIECYDKIYIESYSVPQGSQDETADSENMNKVVRTPIPSNDQGPTPAPGTSSYKKDTAKQTKIFYKNMLPQDAHPTDDDQLPLSFGKWLRPQNEQD